MPKIEKKKLLIIGLILLVISELLTVLFISPEKISAADFNKFAQVIVDKCKNASFKPSCYDREIPKLMSKISMEEAFNVTRIVQSIDTSYTFCHVLGHELSAIEVRRDPSKWRDVLTRCPSGVCSNGCLHGGLQEKFRAESLTDEQIEKLIPDLSTLCEPRGEWRPTGLEQASCYHALGHLAIYMTKADTVKGVALCDKVAIQDNGARDYRSLCYDGVFMQIHQPLEPEDFALIKGKQPKASDIEKYCTPYNPVARASCLNESWPLFREQILTPQGIEEFCSKVEEDYRGRCYSAMFYIVTAQLHLDPGSMEKFCAEISDEMRPQCFANAASRMMEVDYKFINQAVDFCKSAEIYDADEVCFEEMITYSTYNFHVESKEFYAVCNSLPDPWRNKCLTQKDH